MGWHWIMKNDRRTTALLLLAMLATAWTASAALDDAARRVLRVQIALEREGFSAGILDGKSGRKLTLAISEYQRSAGLAESGKVDDATAEALGLDDVEPVKSYIVDALDTESVTGPTPKNWLEKAAMKSLGHETLADALSERSHCTIGLLRSLNPGVDLEKLKVGDSLNVPAVQVRSFRAISRLEVDQSEKVIRGYSTAGKQVALLHCSIAKDVEKRPEGDARVVTVSNDPTYRFDPVMWPEVKGISQKLLIPPGPNNPVGVCWIGLSLKGYGIHGTPQPEMIGKTGSHGCIRLTNWDARRLGAAVGGNTRVSFTR